MNLCGNTAVAFLALAAGSVNAVAQQARTAPRAQMPDSLRVPIVIAHRGASGYRPEHTLAAYDLAIEQGADFIEPDVVITKDGVLVARHEHRLDETTDVADRFPSRRTIKRVHGDSAEGWFVEDFTLAEIKTLRARERVKTRSHAYDGQFEVPTFEEVLVLVEQKSREKGRAIGVYPETKHPSYFRGIGLPFEEPLLAALRAHGLDRADAPVFIQSFEVENLKRLRAMTSVRLMQLLDASGAPPDAIGGATYASMATPAGLGEVARYAAAIGPTKALVLRPGASGEPPHATALVAEAHTAGLLVHVWTFRSDAPFLPAAYAGDYAAEYRQFMALGVDGVFSDFPDHAVAALRPRR